VDDDITESPLPLDPREAIAGDSTAAPNASPTSEPADV
jgi:hypothetical protein